MKNLRQKLNRFCYLHNNWGVPNLMLWVMGIELAVYFVCMMDPSFTLYRVLSFNRTAILHGQIWRLVSFVALGLVGHSTITGLIFLICYLQIGRVLELIWGRFRFNLYYFSGILFLAVAGMVLNISVSVSLLNFSLFLAYATLIPDQSFLIFYIIPIKARWLGIAYLVYALFGLFQFRSFPFNLMYLFVLANYFIYFGTDFVRLFPDVWRLNANRLWRKITGGTKSETGSRYKAIPLRSNSYADPESRIKPYHHRCTVCGKTDVTNADTDFRYCSKCAGYHCYCADHIGNHVHITE